MCRPSKIITTVIAVCLCTLNVHAESQPSATSAHTSKTAQTETSLAGQVFFITSIDDAGTSYGSEYLIFRDHQVLGTACEQYGFPWADYHAHMHGDQHHALFTMTSPDTGIMKWDTTVTANGNISGTTQWIREAEGTISLTFSGTQVDLVGDRLHGIVSNLKKSYPKVSQALPRDVLSVTADQRLVIDVRSDEEFAVSHISGAIHAAKRHQQEQAITDNPDVPVVVYCSVGGRSSDAAQDLSKKFPDRTIVNLTGGLFNWAMAQQPMIDLQGQPTDKVHTYSKRVGKWVDSRFHAEP